MIHPMIETVCKILAEECGFRNWEREADQIERYHREYMSTHNPFHFEYRFCGNLGFGGKLRIRDDGWVVDCYAEDLTPERAEAIDKANARLAEPPITAKFEPNPDPYP